MCEKDGILNDYFDVIEINLEKDSRQIYIVKTLKVLLSKMGIKVGGRILKVYLNIMNKVAECKIKRKGFAVRKE